MTWAPPSREAIAVELQGSRYLPVCTLGHLCREIVLAEARVRLWQRQGNDVRATLVEDYLDDLRDWHWDWVRQAIPIRLHRCVDCQRVQQTPPGISHCLRCAQGDSRA